MITIRDSIYFPGKVRYVEIDGDVIGAIIIEGCVCQASFGATKSPKHYSTFDEALNAIKVHAITTKLESS